MSKPSAKSGGGKAAKKPASSVTIEILGPFALKKRDDRANYEIYWYDPNKGRELSKSTKTDVEAEALVKFRAHYQEFIGGPACCPHCKRPMPKDNGLLLDIIRDYRKGKGDGQISGDAIGKRLDHFERYAKEALRRPDIRTGEINEIWIERFRDWMNETGYLVGPEGAKRRKEYAPATIENSVVQLAAAIAFCGEKPAFKPLPLNELSRTPEFRADIPTLAAMFRYCVAPAAETAAKREQLKNGRKSLLAFLRFAVATWARPEAILDASTAPERKQWSSAARVFHLNPVGRRQTHKYRPSVPVPEMVGQWLDTLPAGPIVPTYSKHTFPDMVRALGFPGDGGTHKKLIRRSMATLGRARLGETNWVQGRQMLGHEKRQMSDVYAFRDPRNWGEALAVTTAICEEIEALVPGAFKAVPDGAEAPNVVPISRVAA